MVEPISEETRKQIVNQFKDGVTIPDIAASLGVSRNTVYKYLNKANVYTVSSKRSRKASKRLSDEERQLIITLYKQGIPIKDIAAQLNVTTNSLYPHIRKAGLRRRVTNDQLEEALSMYKTNSYSIKEILEVTGVSRATLYRHLKR